MSRPDKITTLEELEIHINAFAERKGVKSRFGTFEDQYKRNVSISGIADTFDANYRTALGWCTKYQLITGIQRERQRA
jgi:hypothetical protein